MQAGEGRKQQQPRHHEIKQKSVNKLKSVTQVPALTSSILSLLPLRHRRFPAQKAARPLPECAGKRKREFGLQGKQMPSSSRSPSLFICPQLLTICPCRQGRQRSPSFSFLQPARSGSSTFSGAGDSSAAWQTSAWPSPTALARRCRAAAWQLATGMAGTAEQAHGLSTHLLRPPSPP